MIPYGKHEISDEDIRSVTDVLKSSNLTQGSYVPAFESAISSYCGVKHAVVTANATSSLHIGCLAIGISSGDLVWTSAITFVASANCALYCGARVDFLDVSLTDYNIDIQKLKKKLEHARKSSDLPKAIIVVHLAGQSCEMAEIRALSKTYGFYIIEDASHAIGARYMNSPVGCCEFSDLTVFSFHPVKIITTGEGGAITTNSSKVAKKLSLLRSHGIVKEKTEFVNSQSGSLHYEQQSLGFNYRMTDLQAALGLSQIKKLDEYVRRRHEIADFYIEEFKNTSFTTPPHSRSCYSSFHLFITLLPSGTSLDKKNEFIDLCRKAGVGLAFHYIPVYLHPYFSNFGHLSGYLKNSEEYYSRAFSVPIFPSMVLSQQEKVSEILKTTFDQVFG